MDEPLFRALLQMGDDCLILGQRLCEWCGHAPTIEVDLSLSNLALDLIGQATMLLDYAGEIEGAGRDADRLAFHRDAEEFRNCLLVEQPNGDFAQTIARHFLFSTYALLLLEKLEQSSDERLAGIAAKAIKEMRYHADFALDWVIRLGDGTEESAERMTEGLTWFWRFIDDMFATDADQRALVESGVLADKAALRPEFDRRVAQVLAAASLPPAAAVWQTKGGRVGVHGEHLGHILAEMQVLPRAHPEARW